MKSSVAYSAALIAFLLLNLNFSLFTAFAADDEIARIQEAYKSIEDIKGSFVQTNYMKDLGRTDTYKGVLFIKRPSKMRWEYKGDKPQEIIINNDEILMYKKADKQAFKSAFSRQTYGQAPVALLSGFGKVREEFNITKKNKKLLLIPKNPMGNIVSIEIETSDEDFPIKSFIINDMRSNRIEIQLKDIEINTGIKDAAFDFSLPEGVNIYEYNF
ncbi:MAG: hypothetical protein A2Z09_04860 [Nitrospirae bacterium RBG_16_43_8]|nr:MAG: hypothetical protein A2Z09_04860 [Nitrospirae bacterium RBG_16_43_8]